jgi:hypothetical protein
MSEDIELEKKYKEVLNTLLKNEKRKLKKNALGEYVQPQLDIIGSKEYEPKETAKEIQYKKYWYYAKKYKIPLFKEGHKKTPKELAKAIHSFEMRNIKKLVVDGIDDNTGEIGMYIV